MAVIFLNSTQIGSAEHTETVVLKMLRIVIPDISLELSRAVNAITRKTAHFVEYAALGVFFVRAQRDDLRRKKSLLKRVLLILIFCISYAALDELHQVFVPSRGPSIADVILDSFGAASGTGFAIAMLLKGARRTLTVERASAATQKDRLN